MYDQSGQCVREPSDHGYGKVCRPALWAPVRFLTFHEFFFQICQMSFFNLLIYDINDIKSSKKTQKLTNS